MPGPREYTGLKIEPRMTARQADLLHYTTLQRLCGRVVKGVRHLDHVCGVREVVSSILDRSNIVG